MILSAKSKSSYTFIIWCALLALVVACHNIFTLGINQYLIVALASVYMFGLSYKNLLYYGVFIIPLAAGMNGGVLWVLYLLLLFKSPHVKKLQIIFPVLLVLVESFNMLVSPTAFDFKALFFYFAYLALFFYYIFEDSAGVDVSKLFRVYLIGVSIVCMIVVARILYEGSLTDFLTNEQRLGFSTADIVKSREGYININPNSLGYFASVGFSLLLLGRKLLKFKKIPYVICLAAFLLSGGLTVSRTWLIVSTFALLWYMYYHAFNVKVWLFGALAFFVVMQFNLIPDAFVDSFTQRFTDESVETGSGRTEIFETYNKYMEEHPERIPFGVGILVYGDVISSTHSMHNGTQQILVGCGVFGLLLFFIAAISFYRRYIIYRHPPIFRYMPFIAASLFLQTLQFLTPHDLMFPLAMTAVAFKLGRADKSDFRKDDNIICDGESGVGWS